MLSKLVRPGGADPLLGEETRFTVLLQEAACFRDAYKVAGAVGFEPTDSLSTISSFQDWRHKPLDQTPNESGGRRGI